MGDAASIVVPDLGEQKVLGRLATELRDIERGRSALPAGGIGRYGEATVTALPGGAGTYVPGPTFGTGRALLGQ